MQSHSPEGNNASTTSNMSVTHAVKQGQGTTDKAAVQKRKRISRKISSHPNAMFSDPLDSPSSDAKSFDEDDMYGSDSGVETFSLESGSENKIQSYNVDIDDCTPNLESLEMDMRDLSIMARALCEAEGIDVASITGEPQDQSSRPSSPHNALDTLEFQEGDREDPNE